MVDTNQQLRFCCIADGPDNEIKVDQTYAFAGKTKLIDAFNSPHMKEVRRKLCNGEKVDGCSKCYYQEEVLKQNSSRTHTALEHKGLLGEEGYHKRIQSIIDNDFESDIGPVHLDLRLGNLCNLQCRMCNPHASSQIAKEHFELFDNNDRYRKFWINGTGDALDYLKIKNEWYESDFLWDEIISFIPNLTKVYMTGGEPTLVKGNFKFMQKCIDMGYADKIYLSFNCNCTNINSKFLKLISQFHWVSINASLDGVGKTTEYQRYPSDWNTQVKNLTSFAKLSNVELIITPVLTLYNVLEPDRIIEFAKQFSIEHNRPVKMDYLYDTTKVFSPTILPLEYRKPIAERVKPWLDDEWVNSSELTLNAIGTLIGLLETETMEDYKECLEQFKAITEIYDESRNQNFKETFPELYKIIYETI